MTDRTLSTDGRGSEPDTMLLLCCPLRHFVVRRDNVAMLVLATVAVADLIDVMNRKEDS